MSLKPVIDSLDQVLPDLRQHYVSNGDKFILQMDGDPVGFVSNSSHVEMQNRVAQFRDSNLELTERLKDAAKVISKFEGIDPAQARAALQSTAELSKKGVRKASDVDSAVSSALEAFMSTELEPLRKLLSDEREARLQADQKVAQATLKNAVLKSFKAAGGQDQALDFVVNRAGEVFEPNGDGQLQAKAGIYSSENPGEALSLNEWMQTQTKDISFAFGSSNGGSSRHGDGNNTTIPAGVTTLKNPTPLELGRYAKDIRAGKVLIMNDE
jgi:hypothetical protein